MSVARMECNGIREISVDMRRFPDSASLHPGYGLFSER